VEQVKFLVQDEVSCNLSTTLSATSLIVNIFFLSKHLFNKDGDKPIELLKGDKLYQVMDKFTTLYSLYIQNLVAFYKQRLNN
jgi:hypothetical protein